MKRTRIQSKVERELRAELTAIRRIERALETLGTEPQRHSVLRRVVEGLRLAGGNGPAPFPPDVSIEA